MLIVESCALLEEREDVPVLYSVWQAPTVVCLSHAEEPAGIGCRTEMFGLLAAVTENTVLCCVVCRTAVFAVIVWRKRLVTVHPTSMSLSSCTSVHTCFTWTALLPCTTAAPGSVSSSLAYCVSFFIHRNIQPVATHTFNGPFSWTTRVSWYQKGKTNLDLLKQETVSGSGISWAICKSAPRSRQITMPAPHLSVFYRPDALPATQPTASKHWRHITNSNWRAKQKTRQIIKKKQISLHYNK